MSRRIRIFRRIAAAAVLLLASALGVAVGADPAYACVAGPNGQCYRYVMGTVTTANLNVRGTPWGTVIDNVPNGYTGVVDCYTQASDGSYWDWLYDSQIGRSGWVYDPYLYTGGNIYQQVNEMHSGNCGSVPLTVPGGVHATVTGSGSIHVSWTDTNLGTASYVVSNGNVSAPDRPVGATGYDWTGLAPNTYMCFTVAAKRSGQQSPWSPYACATTSALNTPTNVAAVALSGGVVHVTWTDVSGGAAKFVVTNGDGPSPDLNAGTTGYNWTGLTPGQYMCFAVAAKQSGAQSAWSPYACVTTPTYVNIGDSFAAGEGAYPPYLNGSDTGTDECHRSSSSYSGVLASMSNNWHGVRNVACSGAVTFDIQNAVVGNDNDMGVPAQGEAAQIAALGPNTGLVTVTIGANNLNVAGLFKNCVVQADFTGDAADACFKNTFSDAWIADIPNKLASGNNLGVGLDATFDAIHRQAPNAKVVVSTYPQIFPSTYTGQYWEWAVFPVAKVFVISSADQLDRIRRVTAAINAAVTLAAWNHGFTVCDEADAFSGHEIGTSDPWVNDLKGFQASPDGITREADNESMHPNAKGYHQWGVDLTSARCGGLG